MFGRTGTVTSNTKRVKNKWSNRVTVTVKIFFTNTEVVSSLMLEKTGVPGICQQLFYQSYLWICLRDNRFAWSNKAKLSINRCFWSFSYQEPWKNVWVINELVWKFSCENNLNIFIIFYNPKATTSSWIIIVISSISLLADFFLKWNKHYIWN